MMIDPTVARYCELFGQLRAAQLPLLGELVAEDIEFSDPFNHLRGRSAFLGVLQEMFDKLEGPVFEITGIDPVSDGAYIHWQFRARVPLLGQWHQTGLSRLRLNEDGLIDQHLDYWDSAQLYGRIPLLGSIIRWLRGKFAYRGPA